MNKLNRLVNAIIGLPNRSWYEDEFDLGPVDPAVPFDRNAAENKLRELISVTLECEFVFITSYKELYMQEAWEDSHGHKTPNKSIKKKIIVGEDSYLKKFLVFSGDSYYPIGGWQDFKSSFETENEAIRYLASKNDYDWAHIVDLDTGLIIFAASDNVYEDFA